MEQKKIHAGNMTAIKGLLEKGIKLTVMSCFEAVSTYELKHYVYLLKKHYSMNILSSWVTGNDGKRFKEYWLKKSK